MARVRYIQSVDQLDGMTGSERADLAPVISRFRFRTNTYYQSLIDWNDPDDPIRTLVIPSPRELEEWGHLDASKESDYNKVPGLEHKYTPTALLLVCDVCAAFCRYCFRKRLFMDGNREAAVDVRPGLRYIRRHPEISNVLLTGGDPLVLSTHRLEPIFEALSDIDHIRYIRIGTKIPAFNPQRITGDPSLSEMIRKFTENNKKVYLVAHFDHPRELTGEAVEAVNILMEAGCIAVNQTPVIRGVNSSPTVLAELFNRLSYVGIIPYYVFQCRPTLGNKPYTVPIEETCEIFEQAKALCSGHGKRARYVMSHATGKIEITGVTSKFVVMKYHSAAVPANHGKVMVFNRNAKAFWLEDYGTPVDEYLMPNPYLGSDAYETPASHSHRTYRRVPSIAGNRTITHP